MRVAMLGHLENPEICFNALIRGHFEAKRSRILAQIDQWTARAAAEPSDSAGKRYGGMHDLKEVSLASVKDIAKRLRSKLGDGSAAEVETITIE